MRYSFCIKNIFMTVILCIAKFSVQAILIVKMTLQKYFISCLSFICIRSLNIREF